MKDRPGQAFCYIFLYIELISAICLCILDSGRVWRSGSWLWRVPQGPLGPPEWRRQEGSSRRTGEAWPAPSSPDAQGE